MEHMKNNYNNRQELDVPFLVHQNEEQSAASDFDSAEFTVLNVQRSARFESAPRSYDISCPLSAQIRLILKFPQPWIRNYSSLICKTADGVVFQAGAGRPYFLQRHELC